ncbi:type VI secretion system protein TssL, long form [Curvibacter gracilis]|uniref:type VI secretion system protein TssL, long form n=1 Tax=Curvibacter gracilis TaxID=230310 RepID=UPI003CCC2ECC
MSDVPDPARSQPAPTDTTQRLGAVLTARNPLLAAAAPLLRALSEMPARLPDGGLTQLRQLLEIEIRTFSRLCEQANLRRDHMLAARYALCTALDEAASLQPWGGGTDTSTGPWSRQALLQTFHQEGQGGQKVFLLIGRLAANPQEHLRVLEVMLHVLGLGFEGHYRTQSDGHRMVETIRNRLHALITEARETLPRALSPHWQAPDGRTLRPLRGVPIWMTASALLLMLAGLFGWEKYQLLGEMEGVERHIRGIGKAMRPPAQLRLRELLASDIAAGKVGVDETDLRSLVTFRGDDMFAPGQADVSSQSLAMISKVAAGINEVAGRVTVIGHTDNQPIATPTFPDNQRLAEERAKAVAGILQRQQVDPERIRVLGAGDRQPVADNATAAGRARNRRVEIVVDPQ